MTLFARLSSMSRPAKSALALGLGGAFGISMSPIFFDVVLGEGDVRSIKSGLNGLSRAVTFYKTGIPAYVRYKMLQSSNGTHSKEDVDAWETAHKEESAKGLDVILKLKGFYIKTGQIVACNIGNAFPKTWRDTMAILQDGVTAEDWGVVEGILNKEFDNNYQQTFEGMSKVPIASASIGQVHTAKLSPKTAHPGLNVCVKIQYPFVESYFRNDVRTIKYFCKVAQPVHVPPLEEIENQFMTEFDYVKECDNLKLIREGLVNYKPSHGVKVVIPQEYKEYSTKNVLTMELLNGIKLIDAIKIDYEKYYKDMAKAKGNKDKKAKNAKKKAFIAMDKFGGYKAGYVFKLDDKGLGYYLDKRSSTGKDSNDEGECDNPLDSIDMVTSSTYSGPTSREMDWVIFFRKLYNLPSNIVTATSNVLRNRNDKYKDGGINYARLVDTLIEVGIFMLSFVCVLGCLDFFFAMPATLTRVVVVFIFLSLHFLHSANPYTLAQPHFHS